MKKCREKRAVKFENDAKGKVQICRDGVIEPKRQQDKTRTKMFQYMKSRKRGKRK